MGDTHRRHGQRNGRPGRRRRTALAMPAAALAADAIVTPIPSHVGHMVFDGNVDPYRACGQAAGPMPWVR
jgi:hypothetical protein